MNSVYISETGALPCKCKHFSHYISFFLNINLFIYFYFWLLWVFVAVRGLSLIAASGGHSSLRCADFSPQCPLLLWSTGSRGAGFSSCDTRAQELWLASSRAQAQQLWCTGLVAPWHVGSSQARAQTHVPCTGRQIPNHYATREAPHYVSFHSPNNVFDKQKLNCNKVQFLQFFSFMIIVICVLLKKNLCLPHVSQRYSQLFLLEVLFHLCHLDL